MSSAVMTCEEYAAPGLVRASEENLVAAAIQGDVVAFETLALRYKGIVMAITRRMSGSAVEAEDLTQQALMKAFASISRFAGRCSFSTWLISIAMNEARMWLRRERKCREVKMSELISDDNLETPVEFMDSRPGPEANYSLIERACMLSSQLAQLKPEMRAALQLCDLEEHSSVEASRALGITANGVKSRRLRGRAMLRKRLQAMSSHSEQRSRRRSQGAKLLA